MAPPRATVPVAPGPPDPAAVRDAVEADGFAAVGDVVPPALLGRLRAAIDPAVAADARWLDEGRRAAGEEGRVVSLAAYGGPFLELLDLEALMAPFDELLGPDCIAYTLTSACVPPGGRPRPPHTDAPRRAPGVHLSMGALVLLDDLEEANGATLLLPRSHRSPDPPAPDVWAAGAHLLEAPAGTACWFDPLLWHGAGPNRSGAWRRVLVLAMARSWMKQRLDLPALLGPPDGLPVGPEGRRRLGYASRPPRSYEEYYGRAGPTTSATS